MDFDFFDIAENQVPEMGRILISEPFLSDNYFRRSVVYLTEYNASASIGFVLNKSLNMKINEVIEDFPDVDLTISLGGPVSTDTIHYIHTLGDLIPESIHIKDNIFWGGDFKEMKSLFLQKKVEKNQIRFFLGYSGWGEGQLEQELKQNAWLIGDIPSNLIMKGGSSEFWTEILSGFEAKYKAWANFPDDPGLN